jgi:hypothetical protein
MDHRFADNYEDARHVFLTHARAADAVLSRHVLDRIGPAGEELTTDVAWLGPPAAPKVLVTLSGTHGVEGFYGSAVQSEWLRRRGAATLPEGVAVLHVHALNPYGFAWLRRTNETNIDINRNWIDFTADLPENPAYDELAAALCPEDWSVETQTRTGAQLTAWIQLHGFSAFQQAVSGGQWKHPLGLFFGGTAPSWSRETLTRILQSMLRNASRVILLDFHTGLGPCGYAEPIIGWPRDAPGYRRTRAWIGAAARSLYGDGSVSAEIKGEGLSAMASLLPHASVDVLALECGIRPITDVAFALRADAWLHAHGDPRSPEAAAIKSLIRGAFHSDDPLWQGMALGQGLAACEAALRGIDLVGTERDRS